MKGLAHPGDPGRRAYSAGFAQNVANAR